MSEFNLHQRLINWRDRAWRRKRDLPVYAHMLIMAHSNGSLIAKDHPSWARLDAAIDAARRGDETALDLIEREAIRLRDTT
jgi:hypothetical protein